jgi:hypothetical protein
MMNVMRVVLDTPPPTIREKVVPAVVDEGPQQVENSGGPSGQPYQKSIDLLLMLYLRKILRGQLLRRLQRRREKELKKPPRKTKALIYGTWAANRFPKRIYLN